MNDNNKKSMLPIGILDSGVGGLTTAVEVIKQLPGESILYFGDSKNMPYGNKSKEEIISLADRMIDFLCNKGVKVILLACNTISNYIDYLKSDVPLISIIQAGALDADEKCKKNETCGLIATIATVKSGSYERELASLKKNVHIISNSSASLPKIIDSQLDNKELLNSKIKECIDPVFESGTDINKLILGCSHFPVIKKEIAELYPDIEFIDPAEKQAGLLKSFLKQNSLMNETGAKTLHLYTTAETYEYAAAIKRLGLEVDALIKVELSEKNI